MFYLQLQFSFFFNINNWTFKPESVQFSFCFFFLWMQRVILCSVVNKSCVCVCVSSGLVYTGLDFSEWASTPSPAAQQKQKSRGEPEIAFPRPIKGPSVQRWLPAAVAADKHRYARVKSADVFVCLFYSLI